MSMDKLPKYLTVREFQKYIVNWSSKTIYRKIHDEGMPAVHDEGGKFLIPTQEVQDWIKRKMVRPA
jgi:excisionase family DNA binding protein